MATAYTPSAAVLAGLLWMALPKAFLFFYPRQSLSQRVL
jgi:hypothetical protein